jgi:copper homeostasis protein
VTVQKRFLLEISVESVGAALAAERGGADRIELCANLSVGGVTPSAELMSAVRKELRIPIFAMIRPRPGDFVYSAAEFEVMKKQIDLAKKLGMNGVVLGILDSKHNIDVARTRDLVELARPLPNTFHRAFDECGDLLQALEGVIRTGAARILTSGDAPRALEGAEMLASLVAAAQNRIVIVPGAGINASNITEMVEKTHAREFHSGLGSMLPYGSRDYKKFEAEVRKLAEAMLRLE